MLHFLHAPEQVGFPPIMNADASLGSWRTAYQSALVAMNLFEADNFALAREVGATKQISRKGQRWATARTAAELRTWPFHRRRPWANSGNCRLTDFLCGEITSLRLLGVWLFGSTRDILALLPRRGIGWRLPLSRLVRNYFYARIRQQLLCKCMPPPQNPPPFYRRWTKTPGLRICVVTISLPQHSNHPLPILSLWSCLGT